MDLILWGAEHAPLSESDLSCLFVPATFATPYTSHVNPAGEGVLGRSRHMQPLPWSLEAGLGYRS